MNLWKLPEFPHKGWDLIDVRDVREEDDLDPEDYPLCEVCKAQQIRYVHFLKHSGWDEIVESGCNCAERLITGYVKRATEAERLVRNHFARRAKFLGLSSWKVYGDHGEAIRIHQHEIVILGAEPCFRLIIDKRRGKRDYADLPTAKKAAFDYIWPKPSLSL